MFIICNSVFLNPSSVEIYFFEECFNIKVEHLNGYFYARTLKQVCKAGLEVYNLLLVVKSNLILLIPVN